MQFLVPLWRTPDVCRPRLGEAQRLMNIPGLSTCHPSGDLTGSASFASLHCLRRCKQLWESTKSPAETWSRRESVGPMRGMQISEGFWTLFLRLDQAKVFSRIVQHV